MLYYSDVDLLKPVSLTLVINVSSIVEKFQNIENFVAKYNFKGETNGKLLIYSEKENPAIRLQSFADEVLITNGLLPKEDFVFIKAKVMDGFHYEHSAFIGIEHTDCKNIKWLGSIITNEGNFIWYSNPNISAFEKDAYFRLLKHLYFKHYDQTKLNPRIFKIDDRFVHYTISDSKLHYKVKRYVI